MCNFFLKIKSFIYKNFISGIKSKNKMRKNVSVLYLFSFFIRMNFSLPIELLFFVSLSDSYTKAMSVIFIAHMTSTCLGVPLGLLSDKIGRKKVAVLCSFFRLSSFIIYALAPCYEFLILGALCSGFYRFSSVNADTLLYESLASMRLKNKYHKAISKLKSVSSFSLGIGAVLSGLFYYFLSLRGVVIITILPMLIAFLLSFLLKEAPFHKETKNNPFKHFFKALLYFKKNKRLFSFTVADSLHYGLNESAFTINSAFFKTIIPVEFLGVLRFAGYMLSSVTSFLSAKIASFIGLNNTIFFAAMMDNIVNIFSVLCANIFSPILKTFGSGFFGIYSPATGAFIQKEVSDEERATLVSFTSLLNSGFFALGTLLMGFLADLYSPWMAMLIGYLSALSINFLFLIAFKQKGKDSF